MKKVLLSLSAMVAVAANAQVEVGANFQDLSADPGYTELAKSDATEKTLTAAQKFTWFETTNVVSNMLGEETMKNITAYMGNYRKIAFNGDKENAVVVDGSTSAVTGNNNPSAPSAIAEPAENQINVQFDIKGCQYNFDVKADGYLYIIGKFTTNKNYYVCEYDAEAGFKETAAPLAYELSMICPDVTDGVLGNTDGLLHITIDGYTVDDYEGYYTGAAAIEWPEVIALGGSYTNGGTWDKTKYTEAIAASSAWAETGKIGKNGLGVIKVPVSADMSYAMFATGSKFTYAGFAFSTSDISVEAYGDETTSEDGTVTPACSIMLLEADPVEASAVENITVGTAEGKIFNLAGQEVDANYKGVVIKNGKKSIQ